jgi:hypothetical protein
VNGYERDHFLHGRNIHLSLHACENSLLFDAWTATVRWHKAQHDDLIMEIAEAQDAAAWFFDIQIGRGRAIRDLEGRFLFGHHLVDALTWMVCKCRLCDQQEG